MSKTQKSKLSHTPLPLVSVALATYNGGKYLREQIDSILNQDYPNLELIISDDCSTDNTWDLLKEYSQADNRVHILPQNTNLGYVNNFIRAFRACQGQLIAPSDQDDVWHPQKISKLVAEIGDACLIYCCSNIVDKDNKPLEKKSSDGLHMLTGSDPRNFIFSQTVLGHTMLFQKTLLDTTDKLNSAPYIDWMIGFLAARSGKIKYLDEALVNWRQHQNSTSFNARNQGKASRRERMIADEQTLKAFSDIPGPHQALAIEARDKFIKWKNSYLDFSMFFFVIKNRRITHIAYKTGHPELKYLAGHKLKKLLRPNYY